MAIFIKTKYSFLFIFLCLDLVVICLSSISGILGYNMSLFNELCHFSHFVTTVSPRYNITTMVRDKKSYILNASIACIIESMSKCVDMFCETWVLTPSFFGAPINYAGKLAYILRAHKLCRKTGLHSTLCTDKIIYATN